MTPRRWLVAAILTCLPAHATAQEKKPDAKPKEIDKATVEAWRKRGFQSGWINEYQTLWGIVPGDKTFFNTAVPAFGVARAVTNDDLKELPPVEVPFGLDLTGSKVTGEGLKHLATLNNLTVLVLRDTPVGDGGLKQLAPLKNLVRLDLIRTPVTDDGLKNLAPLTNLTTLYLNDQVTDAGLKELAPLKNLSTLLLGSGVTDAGVKELAPLKNLTKLQLPRSAITDTTLKFLRENNLLHSLGIDDKGRPASKAEDVASIALHGAKVTDAGLKELAPLKNLTGLFLNDTKVTDAGLKELAPLKNLAYLELPRPATDETLKALRAANLLHAYSEAAAASGRPTKAEEVTRLRLSFTKVTDAGLKQIADLKNLTTLGLGFTGVTDEGLKELVALKALKTLDLSNTKVTAAGVAELQKALPDCKITK